MLVCIHLETGETSKIEQSRVGRCMGMDRRFSSGLVWFGSIRFGMVWIRLGQLPTRVDPSLVDSKLSRAEQSRKKLGQVI